MTDLTAQDQHFAFGRNWADYAESIGAPEIEEATAGLRRIFGTVPLTNARFLDIGSGSGLHSLGALRLGAREVLAMDIDPDSVQTSQSVLSKHAAGGPWSVIQKSVFDLRPETDGQFDVVYSWGVLHHTGDMYRAIRSAAQMVKPGGFFAFALYRKTWLCEAWKIEKRWYARASERSQKLASRLFVSLFRLGKRVSGEDFERYVSTYRSNRGMNFFNDVHDWLGGWPYESISVAETERFMRSLGFEIAGPLPKADFPLGRSSGLFGSGCDEYVYRRTER